MLGELIEALHAQLIERLAANPSALGLRAGAALGDCGEDTRVIYPGGFPERRY